MKNTVSDTVECATTVTYVICGASVASLLHVGHWWPTLVGHCSPQTMA